MRRIPRKDLCELVEAMSTMLRSSKDTLAERITKFNRLRRAALETNQAQYKQLCAAFDISPDASGSEIMEAQK